MKPNVTDLVLRKTTLREPRLQSDGKWDDPQAENLEGKSLIALGTLAITFAGLSMRRVRVEKSLISKMWDENTTISSLQKLMRAGVELPDTVLVRGKLRAVGPPVESLAARVKQLQPRMGMIDQPKNYFLKGTS